MNKENIKEAASYNSANRKQAERSSNNFTNSKNTQSSGDAEASTPLPSQQKKTSFEDFEIDEFLDNNDDGGGGYKPDFAKRTASRTGINQETTDASFDPNRGNGDKELQNRNNSQGALQWSRKPSSESFGSKRSDTRVQNSQTSNNMNSPTNSNYLNSQMNTNMISRKNSPMSNNMNTPTNSQTSNKMNTPKNSQTSNNMNTPTNSQTSNNMNSRTNSQTSNNTNSQTNNNMISQKNSQMSNNMNSGTNSQTSNNMDNRMNSYANSQTNSQTELQTNKKLNKPSWLLDSSSDIKIADAAVRAKAQEQSNSLDDIFDFQEKKRNVKTQEQVASSKSIKSVQGRRGSSTMVNEVSAFDKVSKVQAATLDDEGDSLDVFVTSKAKRRPRSRGLNEGDAANELKRMVSY